MTEYSSSDNVEDRHSKENVDKRNFEIGYIAKNVVLDPDNQQTRFYNLQAESTLSSLDSNLDPYLSKDLYLPSVSPKTSKELIPNTDTMSSENVYVRTSRTDGGEGDDEYEEELEDQSDKANLIVQKEQMTKHMEGLHLDLNLSEGPINQTQDNLNEIIFSPGGNEAYVFAPTNAMNTSQTQDKSYQQSTVDNTKDVQIGRINMDQKNVEDREDLPIEKTKNLSSIHPRGERPTTVGQSDDSPKKNAQMQQNLSLIQKQLVPSRSPRLSSALLKHKQSLLLAQVSTTDDTDNLYSTEHSTDPSPRRLPDVPYTRDQLPFLNRDLAIPFQDVLPSPREKDDEELTGNE